MTDLLPHLIFGAYLFASGGYLWSWFLWRRLSGMRETLARQEGLAEGQEHEKRITRLESFILGRDEA